MSVLEMCRVLDIRTQGDLALFKKNEMQDGETLVQCLARYIKELGVVFKIEGEMENEV